MLDIPTGANATWHWESALDFLSPGQTAPGFRRLAQRRLKTWNIIINLGFQPLLILPLHLLHAPMPD